MNTKTKFNNSVLIGFSGGVDSTASCILLKNSMYETAGFYFDVTGKKDGDFEDAKKAAEKLGIELIYKDVSEKFRQLVINNFCTEYLKARTPNPCIICNPGIKFKELLSAANSNGFDKIATGHYARIIEKDGYYYVRQAANIRKDQSYMLYRLGQDVLSRLMFPLGDVNDKEEARELLREKGLENAEKRDSQEICFISSDDNYVEYIKRLGYDSPKGEFIDMTGKVLGEHQGLLNYTIGQRKGLGIALGKPAFVISTDIEKNQVVLGDNDDLMSTVVHSKDNFFTDGQPEKYAGKTLTAKIRYASLPSQCKFRLEGEEVITEFENPQRAVTPGQSIVFYDNDVVIGGGFVI